MLFRLWVLPMNLWGELLVRLFSCTRDSLGFYWLPEGSLLDRWLRWRGFVAYTPSFSHVIFIHNYDPSWEVINHEWAHTEQHARYGPFFLLVYLWYSILSLIRGKGWYRGNRLEIQAREEASK